MTKTEFYQKLNQHPVLSELFMQEFKGMQGFLNVGSTEWQSTPVEKKVEFFDRLTEVGFDEADIFEAFIDHMTDKGYAAHLAAHTFKSALALFDLGQDKVEALRSWGLKV